MGRFHDTIVNSHFLPSTGKAQTKSESTAHGLITILIFQLFESLKGT